MKKACHIVVLLLTVAMLLSAGIQTFADETDVMGEISGNCYRNRYFNLQLELDDSWEVLSFEETANYGGYEETVENWDDLARILNGGKGVTVFAADSLGETEQQRVFITVENADTSETEFCREEEEVLAETLSGENGNISTKEYRIADSLYPVVYGSYQTGDQAYDEMGTAIIYEGDYRLLIETFIFVDGEQPNQAFKAILDLFEPIEPENSTDAKSADASEQGQEPAAEAIGLGFQDNWYNAGRWRVPVLNPNEDVENCTKFTLCFQYNIVDPSSLGDQRVYVSLNHRNSAWLECGTINVPRTGEVFRQEIVMGEPRTIGGIAVLPMKATENGFSAMAWIENLEYGE